MYTAEQARAEARALEYNQKASSGRDLDEVIKDAVKEEGVGQGFANMRVYCDDPWLDDLKEELEKRGFSNIRVPDIIIKGDVYFEW